MEMPQAMPQGMPPEQAMPEEQAEVGGTTIEIHIADSGEITVGLEAEEGGEAQMSPAKDLNDALRMVQQIAQGVTDQVAAPAQAEEDAAYKQEMAA